MSVVQAVHFHSKPPAIHPPIDWRRALSAREAPAATNEKVARCSIGGRARGGTCNHLCND